MWKAWANEEVLSSLRLLRIRSRPHLDLWTDQAITFIFKRYIFRIEAKGFSDFSVDISCPLLSRFVRCCATCYMTSLWRWWFHWAIEIYELKHSVIKAIYHCWAFCSFGKNNNQNTFENNHFDSKRWPSVGIKRQTNWDRHPHTQHCVTKFQSTSIVQKVIKMWVLFGTFWPKLTIMSIFSGVMLQNGRHQHSLQKKANIRDLVTGQWMLCDANSHIIQSKTRIL